MSDQRVTTTLLTVEYVPESRRAVTALPVLVEYVPATRRIITDLVLLVELAPQPESTTTYGPAVQSL